MIYNQSSDIELIISLSHNLRNPVILVIVLYLQGLSTAVKRQGCSLDMRIQYHIHFRHIAGLVITLDVDVVMVTVDTSPWLHGLYGTRSQNPGTFIELTIPCVDKEEVTTFQCGTVTWSFTATQHYLIT